MNQHKLAAKQVHGQGAGLDLAEPGISPSTAGEQRDVGLAQAEPAPRRVLRVRLIDDAVVATFHRVQPLDEFVAAWVPGSALSCPGAHMALDHVCVQPEDRSSAGEPIRQLCCDLHGRTGTTPCRGYGNGPAAGPLRLGPVHNQQPVDSQQPIHQQPGHLTEQGRSPLDEGVE